MGNQLINEQNLEELFDYSPLFLRGSNIFPGLPIYTNKKIKSNFIKMIELQKTPKLFWRRVKENVETDNIVIGYLKKSLIAHLRRRLSSKIPIVKHGKDTDDLGFYDPSLNKIVLVLDSSVSAIGNLNHNIMGTLIHEYIHATSVNSYSEFFSITRMKNTEFFVAYFTKINPNINWKKYVVLLSKTIDNVSNINENKKNISSNSIEQTYQLWENFFRQASPNDWEKMYNTLISMYELFMLEKNNPQLKPYVMPSYYAFVDAYRKIGVSKESNKYISGQEVRFISEISAVEANFKVDPALVQLMYKVKLG